MKSAQYYWEILVPCTKQDGTPVRTRHHKEWDKVVRKYSGGLTIFQPVRGQWRHTDTYEIVEERVIPVRFMATEAQMKKIGNFTRSHYNQHTTMCYQVSAVVHWFTE